MKFAFVTTVTPGYMFALHSTMNAQKHFGTNADFVLLEKFLEDDYKKKLLHSFPNVKLLDMDAYGSFHDAKYACAPTLTDYDVVCLIDADLFIATNCNPYFEMVAKGDFDLVSAFHVWSSTSLDDLRFSDPESINDRARAVLADFPVFVRPTASLFFRDWFNGTKGDTEKNHPLVAFNRAIAKNFEKDKLLGLDGYLWVGDSIFWNEDFFPHDDFIEILGRGRMMANHNKWWKIGRANGEFQRNKNGDPGNLARAERNFNTIKRFMEFFNSMTPETTREDFLQGWIARGDA